MIDLVIDEMEKDDDAPIVECWSASEEQYEDSRKLKQLQDYKRRLLNMYSKSSDLTDNSAPAERKISNQSTDSSEKIKSPKHVFKI